MSKNSETITLNSSNIIPFSNNSKFEYSFSSSVNLINKTVGVQSISIYYSWYNINASLYNNHRFQYKWFDANGELNDIFTIIIPDGNYDITALNLFIQASMTGNGHYTTYGGEKQFYISIIDNPTYYSFQITFTPMYSADQISQNNPVLRGSNTWAFPSTPTTPQLIVNSTGNFGKIIGFSAGVYPDTPQSIKTRINSNQTPEISPITSIIVRCSLVKNSFSIPNDILYTFSQGSSSFGDLIEIKPSYLSTSNITNGSYNSFTLQLFDQNYKPINIIDNQILITLVIQDK